MVNFSRLTLDTNDHDAIRAQLTKTLQQSASQGALVVLDSTVEQELIALIQLLIDLDLQPMAVIDGILAEQARAIQFPVIPADRSLQRIRATKEQVQYTNNDHEKNQDRENTNVVDQPTVSQHVTSYHNEILRTGQCLVQEHGDIIVNASMNSGSEVIASGNIHVYGSVRGRIIAGVGGNTAAKIFCHSLEAELVSIAGTYCVADDIPQHVIKKAVYIFLNEQQELEFEVLQF
ncbi:septum site-determining protein MinC [Acinetobacter larvae]